MKKTLSLIGLLCLTGCSTTNIADTLKALGDDKSTVVHKITTIYGNSSFTRIGATPGSTTTVSPDGTVSIKVP